MDEGTRRVPLSPAQYDERWTALAAAGRDVHGEADLVTALLGGSARPEVEKPEVEKPELGQSVLDAGCGTGRVAIELAARGFTAVGIDVDADLLTRAREKAPDIVWIEADLATLPPAVAPGPFDAAVLAGNVMIFVAPGTEGAALANLTARLAPGGLVVAGFQLSGRLTVADYEHHAEAAGLVGVARWSTWDQAPFTGADYVVMVHRDPRPAADDAAAAPPQAPPSNR
jgi:SAM-dependent methyltransferase